MLIQIQRQIFAFWNFRDTRRKLPSLFTELIWSAVNSWEQQKGKVVSLNTATRHGFWESKYSASRPFVSDAVSVKIVPRRWHINEYVALLISALDWEEGRLILGEKGTLVPIIPARRSYSRTSKPLKMKALCTFETSVIRYPVTLLRIPDELSRQPHRPWKPREF